MTRWFRAYDDALNDPKVQRLPGDLFKTWFNLLCIASKHNGVLPDLSTIAFMLRCDEQQAKIDLEQLTAIGLIDEAEHGLQPHNWNGRQHKSDVSTERVQRFRERNRNVTDGVSETSPESEQNRTESERAETRAIALRKAVMEIYRLAEHQQFPDTGRIDVWLAQGFDASVIKAVIGERIQKGKPFRPLQYFDKIIAEACAVKGTVKVEEISEEAKWKMWATLLEGEARTGIWSSKRVAKSDIPPEFIRKFNEQHTS